MTAQNARGRAVGITFLVVLVAAVIALLVWAGSHTPQPGRVLDEALASGRDASTFPAADEDYFHDMDGGVPLSPEEIKGRNTWIVWTAGNDRFWDGLEKTAFGALDFLKTISSHPSLPASRDNRWSYLGLVNEPCFVKATGPDPNRYGLWLDRRSPDCPADPFENEQKYPASRSARAARRVERASYYGHPTGIVGLRLFPNPAFDEEAAKTWDATRYYTDKSYYKSDTLIRPYRVAMSCGFCHIGPNPVKPPADPESPAWANLSSNVGAQYFLGRSDLLLEQGSERLRVPALSHLASGFARHFADLDRQHQQPEDDERALSPAAAAAAGEAAGARSS